MSSDNPAILLVEDSWPDARLIQELLLEAFAHAKLTHVTGLREALQTMNGQDAVDAVLLDLGLPDSLGMETVEKACRAAADVPVLVLSGDDDEELARRAVEAGTQDYLVKAFVSAFYLKRAIQYAIERKRCQVEMTRLQQQLVDASRQAGMAEVASGVLHNVGNVLTGVNASAGTVLRMVEKSRLSGLSKAARLATEHAQNLGEFIKSDPRGMHLPQYLDKLAKVWSAEQAQLISELKDLRANVRLINNVIAVQQNYVDSASVADSVNVAHLTDQVLQLHTAAIKEGAIDLVRDYERLDPVMVDRYKLLQVLVNLVQNAVDALTASDNRQRRLCVRLKAQDDDHLCIEVADNGVGIEKDNLTRIFAHGFTTKETGHGFGLHSAALVTEEMDGSLQACSQGQGRGATFTVTIPARRDHPS